MKNKFRLMSTRAILEDRDPNLLDPQGSRSEKLRIFDKIPDRGSENSTTIIVGNNGTGKSRLLQSIVTTLTTISDAKSKKVRSSQKKRLCELSYYCEGQLCEFVMGKRGAWEAFVDGEICPTYELPKPARIIAVSASPFDKFPLPRRTALGSYFEQNEDSYVYLGLKDRTGRASTSAAIYRTIDSLVIASTKQPERQLAIARVFNFLGFRPEIRVRYRLTTTAHQLTEFLENFDFASSKDNLPDYQLRRIMQIIEQDQADENTIRSALKICLSSASEKGRIEVATDFPGTPVDHELFEAIQVLMRSGIVRLEKATVTKTQPKTEFNLMDGSSGELAIVNSLLGVATAIEDGSIILIDEPEISLHPSWQDRYLELLEEAFQEFSGCHFVLATHSPLILSDIGKESSSLVDLDTGDAETSETVSGKSTDYLLVKTFGVASNDNHYLRERAVVALRLLSEGNLRDPELEEIVLEFDEILPSLTTNSAVYELLDAIVKGTRKGRLINDQ